MHVNIPDTGWSVAQIHQDFLNKRLTSDKRQFSLLPF
jgi:hypothetical protein